MSTPDGCALCDGPTADPDLLREEVWSNELWRLTTAQIGEVAGFSYLEPRRHIPSILEIDGPEAETLGSTLAKTTIALKEATNAQRVYVYVFGDGISHLHLHLAPHHEGDALSSQMIKGQLSPRILPSGVEVMVSNHYPLLPDELMQATIEDVRRILSPPPPPPPDREAAQE
jgi:diadenosine tetraphosphate (Ap4A) HIT family hydrolase